MSHALEQFIARMWNRTRKSADTNRESGSLNLGYRIIDGVTTTTSAVVARSLRTQHVAILGRTGTGKSSMLRFITRQDVRSNVGFIHFDLHGDTTPYLLSLIAQEEQRLGRDLSERLIVIEPADPEYSVGLNVLESEESRSRFLQVSEFAAILKQRWQLNSFGARTEELLRNALFVLGENGFAITEIAPLLTDTAFRSSCLRKVTSAEVKAYFDLRYDQASEAMQGALRDPVLNKVSAFSSDPRFRHIIGQRQSTFNLIQAIDRGYWVILNLDKGRLGEQAATLGSLFLAQIKNALFSRQTRTIFSLYCDEIQNLLAYDSGLETLLSEARKFGVAIHTANQYLDQYPASMRSAILSVGTHVALQLSGSDAEKIGSAFDGGKSLVELLKNLPPRHFVVKTGHHRWCHGVVPNIEIPEADRIDLYNRCRKRWARSRTEIEQDILSRQVRTARSHKEALDDWE